jgi:hypothetical protein
MDNGFITLHRKITENPIWQDIELFRLFITILLHANYKESKTIYKDEEVVLKRGQLACGRFKLAALSGLHPSTVYRKLMLLEKLKILNIKSNNHFSIITITNYGKYQTPQEKAEQQIEQPMNNQRTQSNKDNNINNINTLQPKVADQANQVLDVFYKINPLIKYQNKTIRKAANDLINKLGLEKTIKAAEYAVSIQVDKYAPTITSPTELLNKYGQLQAYYAKNNIKQTRNIVKL